MPRRPSLPTVLSSLALFIALGGTGLAANHYLITSTSQIKPSVLDQLRGASLPGPQGPEGPSGHPGATGPAGASGSNGSNGTNGAVAGYSATTTGVPIPITSYNTPVSLPSPTTVVSKRLPPGNYIASGNVDLFSYQGINSGTCTLIDTPDAGQAASDPIGFGAVPALDGPQQPATYAFVPLAFNLAIDSSTSASTLTIVCNAVSYAAPPDIGDLAPLRTQYAVVTAVQTSTNG